MKPSMDETMDTTIAPIIDQPKPWDVIPVPKTLLERFDAISKHTALIINAPRPKVKIVNGIASRCKRGLIEALISAIKSAKLPKAIHGWVPTVLIPGKSHTVTPVAIVKINQFIRKRVMRLS